MKLTVGQYQQLYAISKSEDDELEKSMQCVEVITGKSADEMPLNEFNKLNRDIVAAINSQRLNTKPVSFLKSGKKLYQVNYKVGTLRAGQNVELQHWLKEKDWIQNMDKILASIVVPIKKYLWVKLPGKNQSENHEQVAEDMREIDFGEAFGCVVFFCKIFAASINSILPSLAKQMPKEERQKLLILQTDLMKIMDGFTTQNGLLT